MREVGRSPLSYGPFLRQQQTSVSRRHVEHFIDFVPAQIDPVNVFGEFTNEPDSHDLLMESNLDTRHAVMRSSDGLRRNQGPGKTRISASADASVSR